MLDFLKNSIFAHSHKNDDVKRCDGIFSSVATTHDTREMKKKRVEKSENVYYLGTETAKKAFTKLGNIAMVAGCVLCHGNLIIHFEQREDS